MIDETDEMMMEDDDGVFLLLVLQIPKCTVVGNHDIHLTSSTPNSKEICDGQIKHECTIGIHKLSID